MNPLHSYSSMTPSLQYCYLAWVYTKTLTSADTMMSSLCPTDKVTYAGGCSYYATLEEILFCTVCVGVCVYVCVCVFVCVCVCDCTVGCGCMCMCMHACLQICSSVCVCAYVDVLTHRCVCVCVCVFSPLNKNLTISVKEQMLVEPQVRDWRKAAVSTDHWLPLATSFQYWVIWLCF